jgi:hypothetical protein
MADRERDARAFAGVKALSIQHAEHIFFLAGQSSCL